MPSERRAVITGCGALSPLGEGVVGFWEGLLAARTGLGPIRSFDTSGHTNAAAGEIGEFAPGRHLSEQATRRLDRITQFALVAAQEALDNSGLDLSTVDRTRVGVILGTTLGGMLIGEEYMRSRRERLPFPARQLFHVPYYAVSGRLARELDVRGPVVSPSIACASGTQAVGLAMELIRRRHGDVFLVGGAETLCSFVVSGFNCLRATTSETVRPFDAERKGLLLGEGAAVLVVEELEHAVKRGARGSIEIAGFALAGDATHMTAPARDGSGAARAMRAALADAGLSPSAIDFISAHGTGTRYNDAMEVEAIAQVFGENAGHIPVNSIKGSIGHTLGAAGGFEAIMCTKILTEHVIPPTVNCRTPEANCLLNIVREVPLHRPVHAALSTSSAFAGNNAAIVLRKLPATDGARGSVAT